MKKWYFLILACWFGADTAYSINAPFPSSPINNSVGVRARITLSWSAVPQARYQYEIDTSALFDSPIRQAGTTLVTNAMVRNLRFNTQYYWRVRAYATAGSDTSVWSATYRLTTLDRFTINTPVQNATNQFASLGVNFKTTGAVVRLLCDTSAAFDSPGLIDTTFSDTVFTSTSHPSNTSFVLRKLFFGKTHYLKAYAFHDADVLDTSIVRIFKVRQLPSISYPTTNSVVEVGLEPFGTAMSYSASDTDYTYHFEADTTTAFSSGYRRVLSKKWNESTSLLLYFNRQYYIRMRVSHARDTSGWSMVNPFFTRRTPALLFPVSSATTLSIDSEAFHTMEMPGVSGFELRADTSSLFGSPVLLHEIMAQDAGASIGKLSLKNLYFGATYYVGVRAFSPIDTSDWLLKTFTTDSAPRLFQPAHQSAFETTNPLLQWRSFANVTGCTIQLDTGSGFSGPELWQRDTGNAAALLLPDLRYDQDYYWRVKLATAYDTSDWNVHQFRTSPYAVYINAPLNNTKDVPVNALISWSTPAGARGYNYQVSTDSLFASPVMIDVYVNGGSVSSHTYQGLAYGTRYFLRIRCFNNKDTAGWYYVNAFNTVNELPAPAAPVLLTPANNAVNQNYTQVTLSWRAVSNATSYEVQTAMNEQFQGAVTGEFAAVSTNLTGLSPGAMYYWRVRAKNSTKTGAWSNVFRFTTVVAVMPPVNLSPDNFAGTASFYALLTWNAVAGAEYYQLQYANNPSVFGTILRTNEPKFEISTLSPNLTYYWRVRTILAGYVSGWSEIATFRTAVTGVNELSADPELSLFPNPTEDIVSLPEILLGKTRKIEVLDLTGKRVDVPVPGRTIDLSGLPAGIYAVVITTDEGVMQQRIQKR